MAIPPPLDAVDESQSERRPIQRWALWIGLSLLVSIFLSQIRLDYVESFLYDLRVRFRPAPPSSGAIELVLLNPESIEALSTTPNLAHHAELLKIIDSAAPAAILYDVVLNDMLKDPGLARFAQVTKKLTSLYALTDNLQLRGEERLRLPAPLAHIQLEPGPKSSDSKNFSKDGVTRRFLIDYQEQSMIHQRLAGLFNPEVLDKYRIRGRFHFLGTDQAYINFRPPRSYPTHSFSDFLKGQMDPSRFAGKIVIVGLDTQISERDYAATPYSRDVVSMTSAEVHANIIDTLIRNDSPVRPRKWLNFVVIFAMTILTVYVVFSERPGRGLAVLGSTLLVFFALTFLAFWPFGYRVMMAPPLLAVFLCYYFFIPYRLIMENRRSWEIYQKHKLLRQLEELKTNFISMMSHDLKTPIARIQGMADIIQRQPTALGPEQQEALETIRHSSTDLLNFINAILQYGRIEAQQIGLHKHSKDINALLDEVIRKHEFMAKLKRITIRAEFETLFPILVDPELLKQVFSNLLENAIKYSPEGSSVLISSEEAGDRIVVQFADQGPGIPADELPNVFMKFFRSKNAKSSPVKGSGLGLYLARYFTELHGGSLSVESSYGQGSTFTVELPVSN